MDFAATQHMNCGIPGDEVRRSISEIAVVRDAVEQLGALLERVPLMRRERSGAQDGLMTC